MKVKVWNIDWNISDEDYEENLGGLEDDNGLPYAPKDLGLPAMDSVVEIEVEPEEGKSIREVIEEALEVKYTFCMFDFDYVTEEEPGFRFYGLEKIGEESDDDDEDDDTILRYLTHCSGDDPEASVEV